MYQPVTVPSHQTHCVRQTSILLSGQAKNKESAFKPVCSCLSPIRSLSVLLRKTWQQVDICLPAYFWDKTSWSLLWLWTCYMAWEQSHTSDPPVSTSQVLGWPAHVTIPSLCSAESGSQSSVHASQALYWLNCISSPVKQISVFFSFHPSST